MIELKVIERIGLKSEVDNPDEYGGKIRRSG